MPRIAEVLERESMRVDLEQGDFERLLSRRERKQRNRRIRAGAVGVIVALESSGAAAELHVHRHTLRYRVRKIEELTGRDLSNAGDRLELWLALRAHQLRSPVAPLEPA